MPLIQLGPYTFSSGFNPTIIEGPVITPNVVEHATPQRLGSVTEILGYRQPTIQLDGFLAPLTDLISGVVGAVLSGTSYIAVHADDAHDFILGLRSGAQPLQIQSTDEYLSGLGPTMFENDFFFMGDVTVAMEGGRAYPYYPYSITLVRAYPRGYGNSSGLLLADQSAIPLALSGAYLSGYIRAWRLISGTPQGVTVAGLGAYCPSALGGNGSGLMKLAVYNSGRVLQIQTASQIIHSGWNYFPVRPTYTATSGAQIILAMKGTAPNNSWFGFADRSGGLDESYESGITYSNDFPSTFLSAATLSTDRSGYYETGRKNIAFVLVV